MCILFLAVDTHPQYPLIVCANRDEFHHRPTAPAHYWLPEQHILAGQDLQAGGTWLGVNRQGQFAALTNIRAPEHQQDNMRSRGELVIHALTAQGIDETFLQSNRDNYNPFNLVFEQQKKLFCYNSLTSETQMLTPGFHAISNGALDDIWPKMAKGQQALENLIAHANDIDIAALLQLMKDDSQAQDSDLPATGVSMEWERLLSSIYIKHSEYGTRSTSIVLQDKMGGITFVEARYDGKGRTLGTQRFDLAAP